MNKGLDNSCFILQSTAMSKQLTPAMQSVITYFEELGPRWGLKPETCALHALLYLTRTKLRREDIEQYLGYDCSRASSAMKDLVDWRMAEQHLDGSIWTDGEPWDLLFAGIEERRRREIGPALELIGEAAQEANTDGTPKLTISRINKLHELLNDLAAISNRMDKLPSNTLKNAVRFGGRLSKLFARK